MVNRYLINNLEGIEPFLDNIKPLSMLLRTLSRKHPIQLLKVTRLSAPIRVPATDHHRRSNRRPATVRKVMTVGGLLRFKFSDGVYTHETLEWTLRAEPEAPSVILEPGTIS